MHNKALIIIISTLLLLFAVSCSATQEALDETTTSQSIPDEDANTTGEMITLTLASYGKRTLPAVREFNISQDKYYVELVDYSQDGNLSRSEALTRLNTELAKGGGPDLFYLWNMGMDVEVYGGKGFLENLYPYLDDDPELSREDIVDSIKAAYDIDGALYGAISGFGILTMFGAQSELSEYEQWDFNAMFELAQSRGGVTELLATPYSKVDFLESALFASLPDFANLKTGEAYFDSDYYRSVLRFCNELESEPDYSIRNDNPALSFYVISSFTELQYYEALFGDEISFVGYPTITGIGHCFTNITDQFAMSIYSEHKYGAWQFLRLLLTEEYQYNQYVDSGYIKFPTNINAMNELINKSQSIVTVVDEDGNETEVTLRGDQEYFVYKAVTDQQVKKILSLINDTGKISNAQYDLIELAVEEANDYFTGVKTLDEVVKITQQRATIFLAERQ